MNIDCEWKFKDKTAINQTVAGVDFSKLSWIIETKPWITKSVNLVYDEY